MRGDRFVRFRANELRRFLAAVDAHLAGPARIVLIGGSACAIGYGVGMGTSDVDTWQTDLAPLEAALARARAETALNIPVGPAAVGDVPWHYDTRMVRVMPELPRLAVFVLEKHDLALSKAVRCYEHDLAAIEALHHGNPLDRARLVERYLTEMDHAIGEPGRLDDNFIVLIERLFGEIEGDRVRKKLRTHRRR